MKNLLIITFLVLGNFLLGNQETIAGSLPTFSERQSPDHGLTIVSISQNAVTDSDNINNYGLSESISVISTESRRTETTAIWPFRPKYNKNKIQRKNTPRKKNKRNKKLLRKWGLGHHEMLEVNYG